MPVERAGGGTDSSRPRSCRGTDRHTYAVTNDGKRFLLPVPDPRQALVPLTAVLNWPATVKK